MTDAPASRRCEICGHSNPEVLETHHVVPRRHGGSDHPSNLVHLCGSCHNAIESIYDDDFFRRLEAGGEPHARPETPSGIEGEGVEIPRHKSRSRTIPMESPHVSYERLDETEPPDEFHSWCNWIIHCGYCHTVYSQFQQPELANHLQIEHGISNPYDYDDESERDLPNRHQLNGHESLIDDINLDRDESEDSEFEGQVEP